MPGPCPVNVTFEKKMWEMNGKLVNGVSFPNQIARLCQTGIIIADVRHSLRELVSNHDFLQLQKVLFVKKYTALKKNKQIERLKEFANRWLLYSPSFFASSPSSRQVFSFRWISGWFPVKLQVLGFATKAALSVHRCGVKASWGKLSNVE